MEEIFEKSNKNSFFLFFYPTWFIRVTWSWRHWRNFLFSSHNTHTGQLNILCTIRSSKEYIRTPKHFDIFTCRPGISDQNYLKSNQKLRGKNQQMKIPKKRSDGWIIVYSFYFIFSRGGLSGYLLWSFERGGVHMSFFFSSQFLSLFFFLFLSFSIPSGVVVLFARVRVRVRLDISSVWFTCSNMVTHFRGSFFLLSFCIFFFHLQKKKKKTNLVFL